MSYHDSGPIVRWSRARAYGWPGGPARRFAWLVVLGVAGCATSATQPADPPVLPAEQLQAERLLDLTAIDGLFDERAASLTRRVAVEAGDLTDRELEALVPAMQQAFAVEALRGSVTDLLIAESDAGQLQTALEWMENGAAARVRAARESYEPTESMRDFALRLIEDPPSQSRLDSVASFVEAQGRGNLFVLFDQALAEASTRVVRAFRPDTPPFRPLAGDSLFMRLDASFQAAVVTALRDLEPVPSSLLDEAAVEYRSPSGAWFVETYGLGVAEAIRSASFSAVELIEAERNASAEQAPAQLTPGAAIVRSRVTAR